jgi:hypothetical protein
LDTYLTTQQLSPDTVSDFLSIVKTALSAEPFPPNIDPKWQPLLDAQSAIRWNFFFTGLTTPLWTTIVARPDPSIQPDLMTHLMTYIVQATYTLWRDLMENRHRHSSSQHQSLSHHLDLTDHIHHLHSLKDQFLPADHDLLFHADLESFLKTASITTMSNYVQLYGPAIKHSITNAGHCSLSHTPLLTIYGFTTRRNPVSSSLTLHSTIPARLEDTIHRKHTRWKITTALRQSFRNYFRPTP